MKICIINNIYPPYDRGGAEQVVVKIVEGLREAGHEVVIITSTPEYGGVENSDGVMIYRVHPRNLYFYTDAHRHSSPVRFLWHLIDIFNTSVARQVREILNKEKPDIVHTHNLLGLSFLIPNTIRLLGFRHIHTVHDVQLVEPSAMILKAKEHSWRYNGFPTRWYAWLMKQLMGSPNVVISPSQFLLDFYQSRGFFEQSLCTVLRNPVTFNFPANTNSVQRDSVFRFLYLGQVEAHKGVELLVRVYKELSLDGSELHIVGAGSELEHIRALAQGDRRIIVHGKKERAELPELFAKTNMTVVPSLCYENSPTVIFESLHFGVPVLASNIEGIAELIREGENGLTFEAGAVASLKEKMLWCVSHRDDVTRMSMKTSESMLGVSQGEYVRRLEGLYKQ